MVGRGSDIERIEDSAAVRERLVEMSQECTQSLWAFQPGGALPAHSRSAATPLNWETLARGVEMRTLLLDSFRNDKPTLDYAMTLWDRGAEVRSVPALPMRMLIVDRRVAVVPINHEANSTGAFIIATPSMVAGLSSLFLTHWRGASPFGLCRPRRTGMFNAQERQAIELWAQGYPDEAVARRLGVSVRTVRRVSATVNTAIGASGRFQAGVRAAELGVVRSTELP